MATKKTKVDNDFYCYSTVKEDGETTLHGPYRGLARTQDEALNYYCDGDVFEVFALLSVGHYTPRTKITYIKQ